MRRIRLDLPRPGFPSTNMDGLAINPARANQLIGSQQTVAWDRRSRPIGTPTIGVPEPAMKGHSPQTWRVVARHSGAAST
jgi:hypothetical protein